MYAMLFCGQFVPYNRSTAFKVCAVRREKGGGGLFATCQPVAPPIVTHALVDRTSQVATFIVILPFGQIGKCSMWWWFACTGIPTRASTQHTRFSHTRTHFLPLFSCRARSLMAVPLITWLNSFRFYRMDQLLRYFQLDPAIVYYEEQTEGKDKYVCLPCLCQCPSLCPALSVPVSGSVCPCYCSLKVRGGESVLISQAHEFYFCLSTARLATYLNNKVRVILAASERHGQPCMHCLQCACAYCGRRQHWSWFRQTSLPVSNTHARLGTRACLSHPPLFPCPTRTHVRTRGADQLPLWFSGGGVRRGHPPVDPPDRQLCGRDRLWGVCGFGP